MKIKISEFEFTECWDGVLYKKLSDYPNISEWEIQTIYDFMKYEASSPPMKSTSMRGNSGELALEHDFDMVCHLCEHTQYSTIKDDITNTMFIRSKIWNL